MRLKRKAKVEVPAKVRSLVLMAFMAGCDGPLPEPPRVVTERYHTSADGSEEMLYVFDDEALYVQHLEAAVGGGGRFFLVRARPRPKPDLASMVGDEMLGNLVNAIEEGCWITTDAGQKKLLLRGTDPDSPSEFGAAVSAVPRKVFFLADAESVEAAVDLEALAREVPEAAAGVRSAKMMPAAELFAGMVKELRAAKSKAATAR